MPRPGSEASGAEKLKFPLPAPLSTGPPGGSPGRLPGSSEDGQLPSPHSPGTLSGAGPPPLLCAPIWSREDSLRCGSWERFALSRRGAFDGVTVTVTELLIPLNSAVTVYVPGLPALNTESTICLTRSEEHTYELQ